VGSFQSHWDTCRQWDFFGITFVPTGKKMTYAGVNIWRVFDGKVVERKTVRDVLDFLRQLGVIEPTEKVKELFPE
jgi:predicted ester cyclase